MIKPSSTISFHSGFRHKLALSPRQQQPCSTEHYKAAHKLQGSHGSPAPVLAVHKVSFYPLTPQGHRGAVSWLLSNPLRSAARPPLGSEARLPRGFAGSGETLSETRAETKARCVGRCANARCWQRAAERTKLPGGAPLPPSWWDMSVGTALEFHLLHPTWLRRIPYPGSGTRPDTRAAAPPPAPLPLRTVPVRPPAPSHPCPPRSLAPHRYGSRSRPAQPPRGSPRS